MQRGLVLIFLVVEMRCPLYRLLVIPGIVVSSLKEFVTFPRTGVLTLEVTLESRDGDIYVSTPCSYFIGLGNRMVFKKEGLVIFSRHRLLK